MTARTGATRREGVRERVPVFAGSLSSGMLLMAAISVAGGRLITLGEGPDQTVVSQMDLVAVLFFAFGAVVAGVTRTGWRITDPAAFVHLGLVGFIGFQVVVPFVGEAMDLEIATGASRFVGPSLLLLGLLWVRSNVARRELPGDTGWRQALTAMGLLLAVGIFLDVAWAVADGVTGFYDWKRAIAQELGVSNILAAYTSIALWSSVTLAVEDRRWIPAPVVLAAATMATLSRAALLGVVVAAVVVFVGWRFSGRIAVAGLVVVTLGLTFLPIALDTGSSSDGPLASELRVRDEQFTAAWEAWQGAPLFGVGLNRFEEDVPVRVAGPSAAAVDGVIPYEHPNNAWLMALAEVGLVGALLYLALWALLARRILAMTPGWEQAAAAGAVAGLAVHAQLEALTFTRGIEFVLVLLLGALAANSAPEPVGQPGANGASADAE